MKQPRRLRAGVNSGRELGRRGTGGGLRVWWPAWSGLAAVGPAGRPFRSVPAPRRCSPGDGRNHLERQAQDYRLACVTKVQGDVLVFVPKSPGPANKWSARLPVYSLSSFGSLQHCTDSGQSDLSGLVTWDKLTALLHKTASYYRFLAISRMNSDA